MVTSATRSHQTAATGPCQQQQLEMYQLPGGRAGRGSSEEEEGDLGSRLRELVDRGHQACRCCPPSAVDSGQRSMDPGHLPAAWPRQTWCCRRAAGPSWCPRDGAEQALPGTRREPGQPMEPGPGELDQEPACGAEHRAGASPQGRQGGRALQLMGATGGGWSRRAPPRRLGGPWRLAPHQSPAAADFRLGRLAHMDHSERPTLQPARMWLPLFRLLWPEV